MGRLSINISNIDKNNRNVSFGYSTEIFPLNNIERVPSNLV
jgi:hypothetical protein